MRAYSLILVLLLLGGTSLFPQGAAINSTGNSADSSAILDVSSTTKGMLVPRMTAAERGAIPSPAAGLLIYQTDGVVGFYYNSGTSALPDWVILLNENSEINASKTWSVSIIDASIDITYDLTSDIKDLYILDLKGRAATSTGGTAVALNIEIPPASSVSAGTVMRLGFLRRSGIAPWISLKSLNSFAILKSSTGGYVNINTYALIGQITYGILVSDGVGTWYSMPF